MNAEIPLGQAEGHTLEFKAADALKVPEMVAREIVAFLNSDGGVLWIGLREAAGRAVQLDPLDEGVRARLLDSLVARVEPAFPADRVNLVEVPVHGGVLLRVDVLADPEGGPYALIRNGREFLVRAGSQIRPMTRTQLARAFSTAQASTDQRRAGVDQASGALTAARDAFLAEDSPALWVSLTPSGRSTLDLERKDRLGPFFEKPEQTGLRPAGFHFANRYRAPRWSPTEVTLETAGRDRLSLSRTGRAEAVLAEEAIRSKGGPIGGGTSSSLHITHVIEYLCSVFRLSSALHQAGLLQIQPGDTLLADLALRRIRGWELQLQVDPRAAPIDRSRTWGEDDLVNGSPLELPVAELRARPDRCAWLLIRRIYQAFDVTEDAIPWYRRDLERFVVPD